MLICKLNLKKNYELLLSFPFVVINDNPKIELVLKVKLQQIVKKIVVSYFFYVND